VFVNSEIVGVRRHRPLSARVLQQRWQEIRGDFPHGFHALKHYAATWLGAQGVSDVDIAVQLGHVDSEGRPYPELVQRVYNHPDNGAALERIARRLG
jgi:integrase